MTQLNREIINPPEQPTIPQVIEDQIIQLRTQLKSFYHTNITQVQQEIKSLSVELVKKRLKKKQLLHKKLEINKLSEAVLSTDSKLQVRKIQQALVNVNKAFSEISDQLKIARQRVQQYKMALQRYKLEEKILSERNINSLASNRAKSVLRQEKGISSTKQTISYTPTFTNLSIPYISQPPLPTDGPDQPQIEADLANISFDSDFETIFINQNCMSPYANYLIDDELDEDAV